MNMIGEWIVSLEGTQTGRQLALILAVTAAVTHAVLGAMQKGRIDPWTSRAFIDFNYFLIAAPFALFILPYPDKRAFLVLAAGFVAHTIYKVLLAMAYSRAAYTVIYPIVRGTGPIVTVAAAGFVFGEVYSITQWIGVWVLVMGIFGLAVYNLLNIKVARGELLAGVGLAVLTGFAVASYTTIDAYGVRAVPDPFTYLAWLFFLDGFMMPLIWIFFFRKPEHDRQMPMLLGRGFIGSLLAVTSFGSIMLATRLDQVGEAAVLRETSTIFAAIIGWIFLGETVGHRRFLLILLIAGGAVLVELGR